MIIANKLLRGAAGGAGAPNPIILPNHPNLKAMYTMDNISGSTLIDESPNNHDMTMINSPTFVAGKISNAIRLDGVDQNVDLAPASTLGVSNAIGSMAIWFKTTESTVLHTPITMRTSKSTGSTSDSVHIILVLESNGQIRAITGTDQLFSVASGFNDGNWHFVVINKDIATVGLELFIDSVSDGSISIANITAGFDIGLTLGSNNNRVTPPGYIQFFDGDLDQFRYFDRILTQTEINALYNGGVGA